MFTPSMQHAIAKGKVAKAPPILGQIGDKNYDYPWLGGLTSKMLSEAMTVDVSNVSKYYFETAPKPIWSLAEDFRGVTPPFETMLLEFPRIEREYSWSRKAWDMTGDAEKRMGIRGYGVLVHRRDVRPEHIKGHKDEREINVILPGHAQPIWSPTYGKDHPVAVREHQLNATWNVRMWSMMHLDDCILGPVSINDFFLDANGDVIVTFPAVGLFYQPVEHVITTQAFMTHPAGMTIAQRDEYIEQSKAYSRLLDVAFLSLSFMNCRNVVLRKVAPQPLTKKQRKRGDPNRVEHHVIEIEAMRTRIPRQTSNTSVCVQAVEKASPALHIVRGHFKHFGEQYGTKKLFGRVSGKFWWDKHTAGSIDDGMIESDYAVTP